MRLLSVFRKTMREQARDRLALSLSLVFAPFFVFLYFWMLPSGSTTYMVLVMNNDVGVTPNRGAEVIRAIEGVTYEDGKPLLKVRRIGDRSEAEARLRNRDAHVMVIIPPDFSRVIEARRQGQPLTTSLSFIGDLTNPYYTVAAVMAMSAADQYVQSATGQPSPVQLTELPLGASAARTEFENYVPGLLVFSVIMLVFLASMTVTREVEAGTLRRLQLTRMTSLDLLGGISAAILVIGVVAVLLTFLTAWALGFRSQGPGWVAVVVSSVTCVSIIGSGLLVACFARTVSQAFIIANFPLALFMFFSSAVFPLPRVPLFAIAGRTIGLYDILPPTHAVVALNKVLTLGAGLGDVVYELVALLVLSAVYFAAGVWLFQRTHLRAH